MNHPLAMIPDPTAIVLPRVPRPPKGVEWWFWGQAWYGGYVGEGDWKFKVLIDSGSQATTISQRWATKALRAQCECNKVAFSGGVDDKTYMTISDLG